MEHPGAAWYEESALYSPDKIPAFTGRIEGHDWRHETFFELAPAPGRLLDLGCGDGVFLARARERGWAPHGIDLHGPSVEKARQGFGLERLAVGDVSEGIPDSWQDFDAVTAFDFLEHLAEPMRLLERMHELLRPGGVAAFSVPHGPRIPAVFDPVVDAPPHHLTLWSQEACRAALERAGFTEVQVHEKPLVTADLFLHYKWREARWFGGVVKRRPLHYPVYALLALQVLGCRLLGLDRGHSLVAAGVRA